ncbi:MAG TPA: mersacidin/lichenicidin family type 2 lantibiotic [Ktedonobacteraceae bacterium]|jgi:mersacidin/lichenicidin family type 2 lantibiotic
MEFDIVRAWKDASYRLSLNPEQLAQVPRSPVGDFELCEAELDAINGQSQGGSLVGCQFTGGDESQCPTFSDPNGSCRTFAEGPHSVTTGSSPLSSLTALLGITGPLFTCS